MSILKKTLHTACVSALALSALHASAVRADGTIVLTDGEGAVVCSIPAGLPAGQVRHMYNLKETSGCKQNKAKGFSLSSVPSATLITFISYDGCVRAKNKGEYYFTIKTTKQPTHWGDTMFMRFADLAAIQKGKSIGDGKTARLEDEFVGADLKGKEWGELLSCVEVEPSPPANKP